ncbi:MAG: pilin [Gemmatimonas sp.]|nr:pilin [Gemmatimonas sp.]
MLTNKKGFTLIELLIVVVIIGILAAIAIPKFANTKEKAYIASMKSDLRNLVTAQEAYFSDNNSTYAASIAAMGTSYRVSSGVAVIMGTVTNTGWSASATHGSTTKTCAISVGGTTTNEGEPVCN